MKSNKEAATEPFTPLRKSKGLCWLWLLSTVRILLKKVLAEPRMTWCEKIWVPSSVTKVTSVKSLLSQISLRVWGLLAEKPTQESFTLEFISMKFKFNLDNNFTFIDLLLIAGFPPTRQPRSVFMVWAFYRLAFPAAIWSTEGHVWRNWLPAEYQMYQELSLAGVSLWLYLDISWWYNQGCRNCGASSHHYMQYEPEFNSSYRWCEGLYSAVVVTKTVEIWRIFISWWIHLDRCLIITWVLQLFSQLGWAIHADGPQHQEWPRVRSPEKEIGFDYLY